MTANSIKKHRKNYFVMVDRKLVRDNRLSAKAKGIMMYLLDQDEGWQFYESEITEHFADGPKAIATGLKELEECGYLIRIWLRNSDGRIRGRDWNVYEEALSPNEIKAERERLENEERESHKAQEYGILSDFPKTEIGKTEIRKTHSRKPTTNDNNNNNNKNNDNNNNHEQEVFETEIFEKEENNVAGVENTANDSEENEAKLSLKEINAIFKEYKLEPVVKTKKSRLAIEKLQALTREAIMLLAGEMCRLRKQDRDFDVTLNNPTGYIVNHPDEIERIREGEFQRKRKPSIQQTVKKDYQREHYELYVPPDVLEELHFHSKG